MKKSHVEELVKGLIKWEPRFVPEVNIKSLMKLCSMDGSRGAYGGVMEELLGSGILSYEAVGNYNVRSIKVDFSLNPEVDRKLVYFSSKRHAEEFLNLVRVGMGSAFYQGTFEIFQDGEYKVPEKIGVKDWVAMRLKHWYEFYESKGELVKSEGSILWQLVKRKVLTPKIKDTWGIDHMPLGIPIGELNFKDEGKDKKVIEYFFTDRDQAICYGRSFHCRGVELSQR